MKTPVSSIRNLGPAVAQACAAADIHDAETLRSLGPDVAYAKMITAGMRPHFIGYYALVMGLQGRPWNDCRGAEKGALRAAFDQIKAKHPQRGKRDLDQMLDDIGVRKP